MTMPKNSATAKGGMRKVGATVAGIAAAGGTVFAATPATAAYPTSTFAITYGASYYKGTVTWYNRSVGVTGTFRTVGCRRVYGVALADNTPRREEFEYLVGHDETGTYDHIRGPARRGQQALALHDRRDRDLPTRANLVPHRQGLRQRTRVATAKGSPAGQPGIRLPPGFRFFSSPVSRSVVWLTH